MPRVSNTDKPRKVSVEFIPRDTPVGFRIYELLEELIEEEHQDKRAARIACMWNTAWAADADGNINPVRVTLASDFVRELQKGNEREYDVVIQILHAWWMNEERVTSIHRRASLDTALCSFEPVIGKDGDQLEDERNRKLWRHRAPDIQAYSETVERYGLDVVTGGSAAAAAIKRSPPNFKGCEVCRADDTCPNGFLSTDNGVKRCSCWTSHLAIQQELTAVS